MSALSRKASRSGRENLDFTKLLLTESSPFTIREAYKALRTNVAFSLPGNEAKCVGITSAIRGDGKSSIAVNLSISFGQIGKRVVLIDCDMRRPTVASKLGIKGRPGLSDFLVGEEKFENVIQKVTNLGIDVIPAGNIPPDATGLLESKQMQALLETLRKYYHYIIVDLPPVVTVTDAAILSKHIDGFLLVVHHGKTEYREAAEMLRQLHFAEAKTLGFVYNDAPVERKKYYHNYYYAKNG